MKILSVTGLITSLFFLVFSCKNQPKEPAPAPDQRLDFTIVPGERFGLITPAACTREAVLAAYGDSAKVDTIYLIEGMEDKGVVLFPGEPKNTVYMYWDLNYDPTHPAFIRIIGDSTGASNWKTPEGLTLGSSIAEVERLNGKPFKLSGLGWDYGGRPTDWQGGKLKGSGLSFVFVANAESDDGIYGDGVILDSNDPKLVAADAIIATLEMRFITKEKLPDCLQAKVDESLKTNEFITVRKMQVDGKDHYWLADGAVAYDGVEYIYDENCKEICTYGGMRKPADCTLVYDQKPWTTVWENQ